MIADRRELNRKAAMLALKLRNANSIRLNQSFCVFDLAEKMGFEVKFVDIPSMEGVYVKHPRKTILLSSHRPAGRQRFTCAHEIGHDIFGHKAHIDEILNDNDDGQIHRGNLNEWVANIFGSYLLIKSG